MDALTLQAMKCKRVGNNIVFTIAQSDLISGAKQSANGYRITDKEKFLNHFCEMFTGMAGESEEAISEYLDKVVSQCSDDDAGIEPADTENEDE